MSADDTLELVLGKLDGVEKRGGYWMARCPHHEDREPSLKIMRGTDHPVVLKCFAGCATQDVLADIGLTVADISSPRDHEHQAAETVYDYTDVRGRMQFQVVRKPGKKFRQRRPDGNGGWIWNLQGIERVPYRLPQIRRAAGGKVAGRVAYVVEGERDVHAIEAAGGVATCNPGGAGKWLPSYGKHLQGLRQVFIVADKDIPGRAHAAQVAASLGAVVPSISIVEAAEGKDAADHLAAGHGLGDFAPVSASDTSDTSDTSDAELPEPVTLPAIPRYPVGALAGPLRQFVDWAQLDGLHPECAGAAGLAALATLTGPARLKLSEVKEVRAILWISLIGIPSSGKSPAFEHAFARIREHYAAAYQKYESELDGWEAKRGTDGETAGPKPAKPQPVEYDDATVEAVARWLLARSQEGDSDPSGAVIDDELASTLEGLNQYKGGMGADRSKWLKLWTGADLSIQRVGRGGAQNEVHIYVRQPVVSLAGPLTDSNVHLMGKQGSGFRPRFLPHLAPAEQPAWNNAGPHPKAWTNCIDGLLANRKPRTWHLAGDALTAWLDARQRWRDQQDEPEPDDVIEALRKADAQCYRIALVIAESLSPGSGGDVPLGAMRSAVAITDYTIDCWRALPGGNTMAASRADDVMDAMQGRLLAWLESRPKGTEGLPDGKTPRARATRRDVQRWSHLKAADITRLIMEHDQRFPGSVVTAGAREGTGRRGAAGGKPTQYVYAPERTDFNVAATPNRVTNPGRTDSETAGHDRRHSVSHRATPNAGDTETATPNEPDIARGWPADSIGADINPDEGGPA